VLRTEIVATADWPERLAGAWRELAQADPSATPFQSFEWQSSWFERFGAGKKPLIWTAYAGQDLAALFPLVEVRSPWRALRPMGIGPSDYLQPLSRTEHSAEAAGLLAEYLRDEAKARLVDLHQLREGQELTQRLGHELDWRGVSEQAACLVLDLPPSYDAYLRTLGKSLRYDVKRLEKPPFSDGQARIRPVEAGETGPAVDFFFEAHRKRWSKRGLPGAFLGRRIREFHQAWAQSAAERGWLWMSLLELEGRAIGSIYAMRFGKTCCFYQSGFDPAYASLSPGSLLVAHTIRRAIEEGLERFDFLRGDEPYKRRWKPQHTLKNLRIMMASDSALARLGMAWNRGGSRLEAKVRARFEGRGLR
jgi:CelD/BcsL family acetyltransferase involved in cellulose biosynthesis